MKKKADKLLCLIVVISMVIALLPGGTATAIAATPIPTGSDYTIQTDGEYQLDNGYSGKISIGDALHQPNNVTIIGAAGGNSCNARIDISSSRTTSLNLTIESVKIAAASGHDDGINIAADQTVNLYLSGICEITAAGAAIRVRSGNTLIIDRDPSAPTGKLTLSSGEYCAGIQSDSGTVIINGGLVSASGGLGSAGIGGGYMISGGDATGGSGGIIMVNGGTVTAGRRLWRCWHRRRLRHGS